MASKESVTDLIAMAADADTDSHSVPRPPDGGSRAWLVVVGGFLTYFVTFGELNHINMDLVRT
jgi:hypothetical protein